VKASFLIAALVAAVPVVAHAQPGQQAQVAVPNKDAWQLLGEQTVKGKRDKDVIVVGKYEGKFDQIQINVLDSDIELKELTVHFANGEKWSPTLKHSFKEGQRSRAIDLPGKDRTIAKVELVYANTPGGGAARVQVLGRDKTAKPTGPMPATPVAFDPTGWTLLGEQTVNGGKDKDTIKVGKYKGGFDQLTMVVTDSDLELTDFVVIFPKGEKWSPSLRKTFKEGSRSHVIDLPGKDRVIQKIQLAYANLPGGGKAKVQLYGRDAGRPAPPPPTKITWDNKGWTYLGKTIVDGWRDSDRLNVTQGKPFSEVMFVVAGSDVELKNIVITLGNGEKFEMPASVVFKEGTRTAPIDIPGKLRKIKTVDFAYANLPGGGRANLEVWGRAKAASAPPPPPTQGPPPAPTQAPQQAPFQPPPPVRPPGR